jgi:phosphoglycolate phosphatase
VNTGREARKLILFDLDHTLVAVGNQHHEAYRTALQSVYGVEGGPDMQRHQGHTQPNIIRMICQSKGLRQEVIEVGLPDALRLLSEVTISLLPADLHGAVLSGVVDLLPALRARGHVLGLVTGRARASGQVILERSGLAPYFSVRAFGDEADRREDMLRLAMRRSAEASESQLDWEELVVVGDAPPDIEAAKAVGARAVAVASGFHSSDLLTACQPDALLPSLKDWHGALEAIAG